MFAFGENVPEPFVDQVPPVAIATLPDRLTEDTSAHTILSFPALTLGIGVKLMSTTSEIGSQAPVKIVVNVSVTIPAAVSAAVGV